MVLHRVSADDDVFTMSLSQQVLPKYRMPAGESDPVAVYELVHKELQLDGNAAQNLATFCTTWSEPQVHLLMSDAMDKNMIDKDEYPQSAELESRCVHLIADLWNSPPGRDAMGCSTTGSSEACMLGGLALKWRWRKRRQAQGKPADKPNIVAGPVQVCWEKFCRYFDVELRQVPLEPGATGMRADQLRQYVDENTIGVVAILGVTYTCDYEPVAEIVAELDKLQQESGLDIPVHVDAASGGFIAPFIHPDLVWDFRLERVASINSSGHKYGLAPPGVGWVVWRSADLLPQELIFDVDYLGGDMPTFALNFSRPAGEIIAQYYLMLRLGREGYRKIQQACTDTAIWLGQQVAGLGPFRLLYDGQGGLPAISYTLEPGQPFTLYDLTDHLRMRGWQVPTYPLPPDRQDTLIQRVLIRHGVGRDEAGLLVDDIRRALDQLGQGKQTGARARSGFHH